MNTLLNGSSVVALGNINVADSLAPVTFRDVALGFDDSTVADTVRKIEESFARRDAFETGKSDLSYAREKARMLGASVSVARFLLTLGVEPSNVIERKVTSTAMFNAKALKKVVELARFAVTGNKSIEKVMSAFIICALAYDSRFGGEAIGNNVNKAFLSSLGLDNIVADTELAEYVADYQHRYMTGGKDTQSSQARNVLDVLGLGQIVNVDSRSRGGIAINANHSFFQLFCDAFVKSE